MQNIINGQPCIYFKTFLCFKSDRIHRLNIYYIICNTNLNCYMKLICRLGECVWCVVGFNSTKLKFELNLAIETKRKKTEDRKREKEKH